MYEADLVVLKLFLKLQPQAFDKGEHLSLFYSNVSQVVTYFVRQADGVLVGYPLLDVVSIVRLPQSIQHCSVSASLETLTDLHGPKNTTRGNAFSYGRKFLRFSITNVSVKALVIAGHIMVPLSCLGVSPCDGHGR